MNAESTRSAGLRGSITREGISLGDGAHVRTKLPLARWEKLLGPADRVQEPSPHAKGGGRLHFFDSLGLYLLESRGLVSAVTAVFDRELCWPTPRRVFEAPFEVFGISFSPKFEGSTKTLVTTTPLARTYPGLLEYRSEGFHIAVTMERRLPKKPGAPLSSVRHPAKVCVEFLG